MFPFRAKETEALEGVRFVSCRLGVCLRPSLPPGQALCGVSGKGTSTPVAITKSHRPGVLSVETCCFPFRKPEPEVTELPGGFFPEALRGSPPGPSASAGCQQPLAPVAGSRASLSSASVRTRPSPYVSPLLRRTPGTGPRTRLTQRDPPLNQSLLQRTNFQIRSRFKVPGGHGFWGTLLSSVHQLSGNICIPVGVTALGERRAPGDRLAWAGAARRTGDHTVPVSSVDEQLGRSPHPPPAPGSPSRKPASPPRPGARSDHLQGPERAQVPAAAGPPR